MVIETKSRWACAASPENDIFEDCQPDIHIGTVRGSNLALEQVQLAVSQQRKSPFILDQSDQGSLCRAARDWPLWFSSWVCTYAGRGPASAAAVIDRVI